MRYILHCLSVVGTFMMLYGFLYLVLDFTIGQIPFIKNPTFYGWPLKLPFFSVMVILFILMYVKISSPWLPDK